MKMMLKNSLLAERFNGVPLQLERLRGFQLLQRISASLPQGLRISENEDEDEDDISWQDVYPAREKMKIGEDGIAKIAVTGFLGSKLEPIWEKLGMATNYETIEREIGAAVQGGAKGILFSVDSPGGMSMGSLEAVQAIRGIPIPKASHTSGYQASAAYHLGAAAGQSFATQSAMVGSIGSIITFYDVSKMYEGFGVEPVVIASGDLKGTGAPGTSLSAEQQRYLQELVNEDFAQFAGDVRADRGAVEDDTMRGQMFSSSEALKRNLVDATASEAEVRSFLAEQG